MTTAPVIDREFAALIPPPSEAVLAGLEASLIERGCYDPLTVWRGILLDGHNRKRLCEKHGITYATRDVGREVGDRADAIRWICENQLNRRDLNALDRIALARRARAIVEKHAEANLVTSTGGTDPQPLPKSAKAAPVHTRRVLAEIAGVGQGKFAEGEAILDRGVPELQAAVRGGELSIHSASKIAVLPKAEQAIAIAAKLAPDATGTQSDRHNHRARGTGENEWYTPDAELALVRNVLGEIELDPASSKAAQKRVKAAAHFTVEDNGLEQPWHGSVFLNPPYSQPAIADFAQKAVAEVAAGNVREAIVLTHNYTDTAWFHLLAASADAICFTRGRIPFVDADGNKAAPTQGQAFFYFGKRVGRFTKVFNERGTTLRRP